MSSRSTAYPFEMLPSHPQPEPLESLTSYLTRLAQANMMPSVYQLQRVCFPDRGSGVIQEMADYPWASYGVLPTVAACPATILRATTFYHLAYKFQRPTLPQTVGRFLVGNVARSLRFCPLCLQSERPYYSLTWRFRSLTGCPDHGCRLLESCPHCGDEIPFLAPPFRPGVCPKCSQPLHTGPVEPLTDQQRQQVSRHYGDLAYLLWPQPWEQAPESRWVGPRLRRWRQLKQLTTQDVADQTGKSRRLVTALEGYILERGANFQHFLDYVACLGITMSALFNLSLPPELEQYQPPSPEVRRQHERKLIQQVDAAVAKLKAQDRLVSQVAVAEMAGKSITGLKHYPRVKAHLTQISQQDGRFGQKRKQDLVAKVAKAIKTLQLQGHPITFEAIADRVGLSTNRLRLYPAAKEMVYQAKREQTQRYRQELTVRVQQAIVQLKAQALPVTEVAVARVLGVSASHIRYYPHLQTLVDQSRSSGTETGSTADAPKRDRSSRSTTQPFELAARVKQAIDRLQARIAL